MPDFLSADCAKCLRLDGGQDSEPSPLPVALSRGTFRDIGELDASLALAATKHFVG
jgi:hypothetical protein